MNREVFVSELNKININLTNDMLDKLEIYANFLLEYNTHTNLTAIRDINDVYLKHFYDSLTITKVMDFNNKTLLDVGTGAGFPGLVLAICYPTLKVTLLDSNNKKITFLKECVKKLNINNVEFILGRVEELTSDYRDFFDIVTSRAVAELRILMEMNLPLVKIGGVMIAMKGNVDEELENAKSAFRVLEVELEEKKEFNLPFDAGNRTLLKIKKVKEISNKYPRKYADIKKRPLK